MLADPQNQMAGTKKNLIGTSLAIGVSSKGLKFGPGDVSFFSQDVYRPKRWNKSGAAGADGVCWGFAETGSVAAPRPDVQPAARGQKKPPRQRERVGVRHQVRKPNWRTRCLKWERRKKVDFKKSLPVWRKCEVSLDYTLPRKSSLSSDSNKTYCMLGHCASSEEVLKQGGHWNMGTVLLFNGKLPLQLFVVFPVVYMDDWWCVCHLGAQQTEPWRLTCWGFLAFYQEVYWMLLLLPLIGFEWLKSLRVEPANGRRWV